MRVEAKYHQRHMEEENLGHRFFDCETGIFGWIRCFASLCHQVQASRFDIILQVAHDKLNQKDFELFTVCL